MVINYYDNVAITFLQNNDINQVVAYDGNLSYDIVDGEYIPRRSKFPYSFPEYSMKRPKFKIIHGTPYLQFRIFGEGEVIFSKDSDGNIIVDY